MNYRHAFHAGNFADCMKHGLLVWLLAAMARKASPFFVLDTHAGAGHYDLTDGSATRTGEAEGGISRLPPVPPAALANYASLVRRLGLYPGSPAIVAACLRPGDRLACCELHPEDAAALRQLFAQNPAVAIHRRDAWEALGALLPPMEKRGLVLIDPPYEDPDEFSRLTDGLKLGHSRFRTGVFAAWYPIKRLSRVRQFLSDMRACGMRDIVTAEFLLRAPLDPARLNGCGLLVVNPPFQFETAATAILQALLDTIGTGEPGQGIAVSRIADE